MDFNLPAKAAAWRRFAAIVAAAGLALSASLPAQAQSPLAGSWYFDDGVHIAAFTFFANGEYKFAQVGPADLTGHSGIERGTWAWDAGTHILTAAVVTDTNGEWGLSHPRPILETVEVQGDQFIFAEQIPGGEVTVLDRLTAPGSVIVNGWSFRDTPAAGDLNVLWFLPDGRYLAAFDPPGVGYYQLGSYAWDATTGALSTTALESDIPAGSFFSGFQMSAATVAGGSLLLDTSVGDFALAVTNVPEPQTYALLLAGLALLGFAARRRRNLK